MALLLDSNEYSFHFYNQEDENNIAILISLSVLKLSIDPFKDSTENIFDQTPHTEHCKYCAYKTICQRI